MSEEEVNGLIDEFIAELDHSLQALLRFAERINTRIHKAEPYMTVSQKARITGAIAGFEEALEAVEPAFRRMEIDDED